MGDLAARAPFVYQPSPYGVEMVRRGTVLVRSPRGNTPKSLATLIGRDESEPEGYRRSHHNGLTHRVGNGFTSQGGLATERFAGSQQQDNRHGITLGMATRPSRSRGCRECNGGADGGHGDRDDTLGEAKAVRRQRLSPQGNLKEPNERTFSPVRVGGQPTHPEY